MGWIMVASGLVDKPQVSHYRLAAHLLLALFILAYFWKLAWQFYTEKKPEKKLEIKTQVDKISILKLKRALDIILVLLIAQIFYGALVAGLHAGLMYNTFPDMEGQFFPSGAWRFEPLWKNIFENPLLVQWIHRILAWTIFFGVFMTFLKFRAAVVNKANNAAALFASLKSLLIGLVCVVSTQFLLGVFTLLLQVKLPLAVTHQVGASVVLLVLLWLRWEVIENITSRCDFT
jgi:cytochrome c oxidase assembly protein subunit 15